MRVPRAPQCERMGEEPGARWDSTRRIAWAAFPVDVPEDRLQALGRCALYVAHEVKTMVAVTRGGLSALERGAAAGSPADPQTLRVLHGALTRASCLLDEILYFGTRRALRRKRVVVTEMVRRIARFMRTVAEASLVNTSVTERYDAAPLLWADEALLEASLTNLAFNGLQALQSLCAEGGRLHFEVSAHCGEAVISIHNSGSPASDTPLDELLRGGLSCKDDGTGLGLIIARAGVEAHGGRLVFETTEDNGVRATVLLPASMESA